ncbi:hypothetical protein ACFL6Y_09900 [Elusimicrobiota bacterium]
MKNKTILISVIVMGGLVFGVPADAGDPDQRANELAWQTSLLKAQTAAFCGQFHRTKAPALEQRESVRRVLERMKTLTIESESEELIAKYNEIVIELTDCASQYESRIYNVWLFGDTGFSHWRDIGDYLILDEKRPFSIAIKQVKDVYWDVVIWCSLEMPSDYLYNTRMEIRGQLMYSKFLVDNLLESGKDKDVVQALLVPEQNKAAFMAVCATNATDLEGAVTYLITDPTPYLVGQ